MSLLKLRQFIGERLKFIRETSEIGNRAARREYDISKSCIRDWSQEKENLKVHNLNVP